VQQSNFDIRNLPTYYTVDTNAAGGTTTDILIPTAVLPILGPLVVLHFNQKFIANLDGMLRPIIDAAYDRPDMDYGIPPTIKDKPVPPVDDTAAAAVPETVKATLATDTPTFATRVKNFAHDLQEHTAPKASSKDSDSDETATTGTTSDTAESADGGTTDTDATGTGSSAAEPDKDTSGGDSTAESATASKTDTTKTPGSRTKKTGGWKLKVGAGKHAAATASSSTSSGGDE
jgi:3'-(hydroxy)phthioceranyl-2'-palmitoyl(stearoyl)-2-O-sulfo-trehalose (hydroxy)phthioceranyltransferase